jgi:hypothetical protein
MSMSMLKGIHRRMLGIGVRDEVIARSGFVAGGEDRPAIVLPGNPDTVAQFDDFLGDLIADEWAVVKSDTGIPTAALANITNGVLRLSGSETQPVTAAGGAIGLTQGLFKQWKADMGGRKNGRLRLSARIKAAAVSATAEAGRVHMFIGFSDSGGDEFPAYDTGAGVISNAADVVGLLYAPSSASYSDRWTGISAKSVAGDSGDQIVAPSTAIGPASNTYTTVEVEVRNGISDTGGAAHFWVDGKKIGVINSPVKSDAALTPWIGAWMQDTGLATSFDIDYVAISSPRDTGE